MIYYMSSDLKAASIMSFAPLHVIFFNFVEARHELLMLSKYPIAFLQALELTSWWFYSFSTSQPNGVHPGAEDLELCCAHHSFIPPWLTPVNRQLAIPVCHSPWLSAACPRRWRAKTNDEEDEILNRYLGNNVSWDLRLAAIARCHSASLCTSTTARLRDITCQPMYFPCR